MIPRPALPRALPPLLVGLAALFLLPGSSTAQTPPRIEKVRIGLPAGRDSEEGRARIGCWTPLAVTLKAGERDTIPQGVYTLAVETSDFEDYPYRCTAPVPALSPGEERVVFAYVEAIKQGQEFTLALRAGGKTIQQMANLKIIDVEPDHVIILAVGPGLSWLKRACDKLDARAAEKKKEPLKGPKPQNPPGEKGEEEVGDIPEEIQPTPRRDLLLMESVQQMPDRWFGYDGVEVIVMGTDDEKFVGALLEDGPRRSALAEWVRRGGQLVISAGRNAQEVNRLLQRTALLDCEVAGDPALRAMELKTLTVNWCNLPAHLALKKVEMARLTPRTGANVLVREGDAPILVQGSCGLGRVVLCAFDLDRPPFSNWTAGQLAFLDRLQTELAPTLHRKGADQNAGGRGMETEDLQGELRRELETFEHVTPISFGWVALFLLFYIALVGPLDYFVLKKLFKKLELTWITFPLTVLVVSVAAYLSAYTLKGEEIRINKIDLVEIDLHPTQRSEGGAEGKMAAGQVYGTTWFGVFSPRPQGYTLGVEPATAKWVSPLPTGTPGTLLSLVEVTDRGLGRANQTWYTRPYEFAEGGTGVRRAPVPTWAARSFTAAWRGPLTAENPPIEIHDAVNTPSRLSLGRDGSKLAGRVTNNLGVELQNVAILYGDNWFDLGTLAPGQTVLLDPVVSRPRKMWFERSSLYAQLPMGPVDRAMDPDFLQRRQAGWVMQSALFHSAFEVQSTTNKGLRHLDQSWRLKRTDEAILVTRTPLVNARAEVVTESPVSPSRLWVGSLPGDRPDRPTLAGELTQETFVRVYVPVVRAR